MDTIKVTTDSGKFVIKTPFHLNGLVRTVPGARWSNPRKAYVAPFSRKAAEMLSYIKAPIEFDKSAIELMAQAVKASEKIVREPFPAWYSFKTKPMPHQQRALNYIWGMKEFALFMGMRCISGDAVVKTHRRGKTQDVKLRDFFRRFHNPHHLFNHSEPWKVRALCGETFGQHAVKNVHFTGEKETVAVLLDDGKKLICTPDHKVLTFGGFWVEAQHLVVGQEVVINGAKTRENKISEWKVRMKFGQRAISSDGYAIVYDPTHPRAHKHSGQVREHIAVAMEKLGRNLNDDEIVHHVDGNKLNNHPDNLEVMTISEHGKIHKPRKHMDGGVHPVSGGKIVICPKTAKVVSVTPYGTTDVYDIEMEDPWHNFVADGIVVHNCGKTKTIIDLACALKMSGLIDHALIIPPISVRHEWARQVTEHAPIPFTTGNFDLTTQSGRKKCTAFFESPDEFKMMLVGVESFSAGQAYDWAVDFIRSHGRVLTLIDESQNIKNHRGVRTDKITELGLISEYKGIMTGTPTGKDVLDLYAQFYFLNPDIIGYSDYWSFRNRYAVFGGYENKQIIGFNNVEELMTAIKPYTFQVTTEEAAPDLPPKQYIQRTVQMPAHTKTVYNSLTKHKLVMYNGEELHMKSSLERTLRQSMLVNGIMVTGKEGVYKQHHENSAKLAELAAVIEEYTLPTIIWGTLDAEIDRICEHLTSLGKTWTVIDGRVAKEERPNREKLFQSGQVDYLVAKAGVGGVGLCFDRAEVMVYMSNSFKYIDRKQSEERATNVHKGKGGVLIVDIIMEDSVDDKVIIPAMMAKEDVSQYIKKHMSNTIWGDDKEPKDEQIL